MKRRDVLKGLTMTAGGAFCAGTAHRLALAEEETKQPPLAMPIRALVSKEGKLLQPIRITLQHPVSSADVLTEIDGQRVDHRSTADAAPHFDLLVDAVQSSVQRRVTVTVGGDRQSATVELKPVRKMLVYILPHSHHDLGYTDLQANVEAKQMDNIAKGIALAQKTAAYPEGARFVWNLEVLWGADLYMQRRSENEKAAFRDAVKQGWLGLNGSYANELTGLCRPEELLQLFRYGTRLASACNTSVNAAMMSDVPGFSWGTVDAMAQAGIRYFSAAPNFFDRIGTFMVAWQDKPFWWVSRSGKQKILFWVPWTGYAMSHVMKVGPEWVAKYQDRMDDVGYPYDISYIRWSGHGDNAEPDPEISEFVKSWNQTYTWPRFHIASTSTAFSAFEQRYGDELPTHAGDLTPYWEDGAASSALETAMSRNAAEQITQAAALSAVCAPSRYSPAAFREAWRNVLLYSEHTWGAWSSVSDSESPFVTQQWEVKRGFAVHAQQQSAALVLAALPEAAPGSAIAIYNTNSWDRSEVVLLSAELSNAGDFVTDEHHNPVPSQRLATGELAVLVTAVPAFGSRRYTVRHGHAHAVRPALHATLQTLANEHLSLRIDPRTGDIVELRRPADEENLVDTRIGPLNQFLYMEGDRVDRLQRSGKATITLRDAGPLVATLEIESPAPSCNQLTRRLRLAAHQDYVELINIVDKQRAPLNPNPGKGGPGESFAQRGSKESIQFAFPFAVPQGKITMDIPLAEMQPEIDQLPGACRNWLPVGRWIDVSGPASGVTWATLDAPLVEIGGITATMLGSQKNPDVWRKKIDPTQVFYSWVMNNHWGTNYRAYQQGPVTFRYALRPHRGLSFTAAATFATGLSQPLIAAADAASSPSHASLLRVTPQDVLVETLKPSDDGKAWIVRLFGASGEPRNVTLTWASEARAGKLSISNLAEEPLQPVNGPIPIAGWDLVTLRVERKQDA